MTQDTCVIERPSRADGRAPEVRRLRSRKQLVEALDVVGRGQVWVVRCPEKATDLLRAMAEASPRVRKARLVCHVQLDRVVRSVLESFFDRVVLGAGAMLPYRALVEVLRARHPEDFCIAAEWDEASDTLALWRGDLTVIVVPMETFRTGGARSPAPEDLSVEDCGQTIRMGEYEASFDGILYERDPAYRKRARKRMIQTERGLGPSIRRLRIQRGLARSDFPSIDAKTVARIERGEVQSPRKSTLRVIAKRLGVPVEQVGEF